MQPLGVLTPFDDAMEGCRCHQKHNRQRQHAETAQMDQLRGFGELLEGVGQRAQDLVHDHAGVEDDGALLARAVLKDLLPVRALVTEDLLGRERMRRSETGNHRGCDSRHDPRTTQGRLA